MAKPWCAHCDSEGGNPTSCDHGRRRRCPACCELVCPSCFKASTPTDCFSHAEAAADGGPPPYRSDLELRDKAGQLICRSGHKCGRAIRSRPGAVREAEALRRHLIDRHRYDPMAFGLEDAMEMIADWEREAK